MRLHHIHSHRNTVGNRHASLTRPSSHQLRLSTGRWHQGVWAGKRDGTKPLEIPNNCLTCCHATADLSNSIQGGERGWGYVPSPSLSNDNLVQPGWTHAFAASWANPLTLLSLVLLQSDCMIICVPIFLSHSVWEQWKSGTKCTIVWMFGWFFNCCCCCCSWPHGLP